MRVFRQVVLPGILIPVSLSTSLKIWLLFFKLPIFQSDLFAMLFAWIMYYGLYIFLLWQAVRQSRALTIFSRFFISTLSILVFDFTNALILGLWNQWDTVGFGSSVDYSFLTGPIFFSHNYMLFSRPLTAGILIIAALCLERIKNIGGHRQEKIKSFILGTSMAMVVWIIMPMLLITWNNRLGLPVYGNAVSRVAGLIIFSAGLAATLLIVGEHLKTGRVTPLAVEKPIKFIAQGVYRYSRNPMYLTILTSFFGGWLFFGHLLLLVYVLLAIPAVYLIVVLKEEPELKRIFGKEYINYLKRVPRWF